jgi:hypothetical protein
LDPGFQFCGIGDPGSAFLLPEHLVKLPAGESEGLFQAVTPFGDFPEAGVLITLDYLPIFIRQRPNAPQAVLVVIIDLSILLQGQGIINGQGVKIAGFYIILAVIFKEDVGAVIEVAGDLAVDLLLDPPAKGVVLVQGQGGLGFNLDQLIIRIVGVSYFSSSDFTCLLDPIPRLS